MKNRKAQVWVETVIYTLIGISIIGILLAVAKPRIEEVRDRMIIEQTIESFNEIHGRIIEIQSAPGYQRTVGFKLSKGKIIIDGGENKISWKMESKYEYSQPGSVVEIGKIKVLTESANPYTIEIYLNYPEYNLTVSGSEKSFEMEESPTPYNILFSNKGGGVIDITIK